jgi:hypothetical protein
MATLAEMLRQGADKLINLPSEAQRFVTNPQAFTQLLTGKNPLPRETGFAAGATGLPPTEMSVLDPNQAAYMQGYSEGEPIGYAGMAAPFAAPAAVATGKALAPKLGQVTENYMVKQGMIQPLTAYHGTPHTIQGQFDINKVGTGEGNQTFGYGMYFAENPEVATQYRKMLSTPFKEKGSASQLLDMANGNYDEALKLAQKNKNIAEIHSGKAEHIDSANKTIDILNKMKNGEKLEFGNIYKVDIPDADIPKMVTFETPLSDMDEKLAAVIKPLQEQLKNQPNPDLFKNAKSVGDVIQYSNAIGLKPHIPLQEAGFTGIRYLDEGSRSADQRWIVKHPLGGENDFASLEKAQAFIKKYPKDKYTLIEPNPLTSNFVVFEPSTVKILEKNDKPVTRKELIQEQINKIE